MTEEERLRGKLVQCWRKRREYQVRLLSALDRIRVLTAENKALRKECGL